MLGVNERVGLKLFGREIIFEEFQLIWSRYLIRAVATGVLEGAEHPLIHLAEPVLKPEPDRQTDDMQ